VGAAGVDTGEKLNARYATPINVIPCREPQVRRKFSEKKILDLVACDASFEVLCSSFVPDSSGKDGNYKGFSVRW
jgi:hypothetical protein